MACATDSDDSTDSLYLTTFLDSQRVDVAGHWTYLFSDTLTLVLSSKAAILSSPSRTIVGSLPDEPSHWVITKKNGVETKRPAYKMKIGTGQEIHVMLYTSDTLVLDDFNHNFLSMETAGFTRKK